MGLSTTAVHAIWVVAILVGGGALGTTLVREVDETRLAGDALFERGTSSFAETFEILDAGLDRDELVVPLALRNTGRATLDVAFLTVLFDGVVVEVEGWEVGGVANTRVWPPGAYANLTVTAPWEPHRVVVGGPRPTVWENTEPPRFVDIVVTPDPASVEFLASRQFTASGTDQYGDPYVTTLNVAWSTDLPGSSVGGNGLFTAGTTVGVGRVTAVDGGVNGYAVVTVYRNPPVLTTMTLAPATASVEFLAMQAFTPTCYDQYALVMTCPALGWSTTVVASTVDGSGLFTAGRTVSSGVVAAESGGVSATSAVDVYRDPAVLTAIEVAPDPASVEFLDTESFSASCFDQYDLAMACSSLAWTTTVSGSSVSSGGLFTAGTAVATGLVTASSGGVAGSADVDVYRNAAVLTAIDVAPASASVEFLATRQFTATCADQYALAMTCPTLAWTTTVSGASVGASGLFTAGTTAGSGEVRAASGGVFDTSSVTVYRNAAVLTGISLSPTSASVEATRTRQFTAACTDQYALAMTCPTLTWSTTVAAGSVSSTGLFTAGTTLSTGGVVRAQSGAVSGSATTDVVALQVYVAHIKMFRGNTEQYSFKDTDTSTSQARVVAVLDGADVPNVVVTLVTKNPSGTTVDTDAPTTTSAGLAEGSYRPGQGAALGGYTLEVTNVAATWITYRSDLNTETVQAYTVVE